MSGLRTRSPSIPIRATILARHERYSDSVIDFGPIFYSRSRGRGQIPSGCIDPNPDIRPHFSNSDCGHSFIRLARPVSALFIQLAVNRDSQGE